MSEVDLSKRQFMFRDGPVMVGGIAALVSGLWTPSVGEAASCADGWYKLDKRDMKVPDDDVLKAWMKQNCDETLAGTNYVAVDDANFRPEVYQEAVPVDQRSPVMTLFYNDRENWSRGDAALARVIHETYPEFKFCGYRVSGSDDTPDHLLDKMGSRYNLKRVPAVMFYNSPDGGELQMMGKSFNMHGGIKKLKVLHDIIDFYEKEIPKSVCFPKNI